MDYPRQVESLLEEKTHHEPQYYQYKFECLNIPITMGRREYLSFMQFEWKGPILQVSLGPRNIQGWPCLFLKILESRALKRLLHSFFWWICCLGRPIIKHGSCCRLFSKEVSLIFHLVHFSTSTYFYGQSICLIQQVGVPVCWRP